jgi:hypothetical protein
MVGGDDDNDNDNDNDDGGKGEGKGTRSVVAVIDAVSSTSS